MTEHSHSPIGPRIFSIANQKGGVGKTTTAVNLGTALGAVGKNVLLIDLDPQGNASTGLGIDRHNRSPSVYEVLLGESEIIDVIRGTEVPNLYVAPASSELAGAEIELIQKERRSFRLKDAIGALKVTGPASSSSFDGAEEDAQAALPPGVKRELSELDQSLDSLDHADHALAGHEDAKHSGASGSTPGEAVPSGGLIETSLFDFVLIDCPPSLNLLTVNALAASHGVIVPLQCEFFALEGLSQLLQTIEGVRAGLNPGLEIQGVILTMYDRRNNLSGQVEEDVRTHLGDRVYNTVIPRNVRMSEAPSFGKPALLYDYKCPGSQAYIKLAVEVIQRERSTIDM